LKKLTAILSLFCMLLGTLLIATGCSHGKTIKVDGWTLYRFNGEYNTVRGRVNIISADSESLAVDGVLTIPAKIGKYNIYGFGRPGRSFGESYKKFSISQEAVTDLERIVVAAELYIDSSFSNGFPYVNINGTLNIPTILNGRTVTWGISSAVTENFLNEKEYN
jgi:hypothetical protein